jgi:hypothetical protein
MERIIIKLDEDGVTRFLVNADTAEFLTDTSIVKRASHVEPDRFILRILFHGIRYMFGENGRMANFTRVWPCIWRTNLAPSGGPILPERYRNRKDAIDAEIAYLNENFI